MTEDEAKTKWCPFVRLKFAATSDAPSCNRDEGQTASFKRQTMCIGSACMAWRWLPLLADEAFKNAVIKAAGDIGDKTENRHKAAAHVIANRAAYGLPTQPFDGFCGLAGKP